MAIFSKGKVNKNRNSVECFYCRKHGHTTFNCKTRERDHLNGELNESARIATIKYLQEENLQDFSYCGSDNEFNTYPHMVL